MIRKIANTLVWVPHYLLRGMGRGALPPVKHLYFCICDHFEPYWNGADGRTARKRILRWMKEYPKVAEQHRDSSGRALKYSFFYPEEEYRPEDMAELSALCSAGLGEVEVHLHHDNDTAEKLRHTLLCYKHRLYEKHGLLSKDRWTGDISYAFIHGNWALDNSRPDGRWCGVQNEISVLQETGCYADLTMPSAPNETQTRKVNSIYYALGDPTRRKSHDWGVDARVGPSGKGLLMIQGPLALNWQRRKFGVLPRIENGGLLRSNPPTRERVKLWVDTAISVIGAPEHRFVKIYTHGTQEQNTTMLFDDGGLRCLCEALEECAAERGFSLHYVSARELANTILAIEAGNAEDPVAMYDYRYK
jgi:hypothetical protein